MPTPRPADRVNNRDIGAVATDQLCSQSTCLAKQVMLRLCGGRLTQPPVQMQLRLNLPSFGVDPFAARRNDNGRWAEKVLENLARLKRALVAFDAKADTLADVVGLCAFMIPERCDWRTEDGRYGPFSSPAGVLSEHVQEVFVAKRDGINEKGLLPSTSTVGKCSKRDISFRACVLEHDRSEAAQHFAVGCQVTGTCAHDREAPRRRWAG